MTQAPQVYYKLIRTPDGEVFEDYHLPQADWGDTAYILMESDMPPRGFNEPVKNSWDYPAGYAWERTLPDGTVDTKRADEIDVKRLVNSYPAPKWKLGDAAPGEYYCIVCGVTDEPVDDVTGHCITCTILASTDIPAFYNRFRMAEESKAMLKSMDMLPNVLFAGIRTVHHPGRDES